MIDLILLPGAIYAGFAGWPPWLPAIAALLPVVLDFLRKAHLLELWARRSLRHAIWLGLIMVLSPIAILYALYGLGLGLRHLTT